MSSLITNSDLERPTTSSQHADMDDADEEEVLIEPRFKYSRTLNDVSKVLVNDSPSCIAIHDKFIAMGCQSGRIYLFDHLGNGHMECTARHHKCAVSCISIDKPGNYFVSCANDFTVSIFGIGSNEYNQNIDLRSTNHAAKSVCIAEDFSRSGSGHRFVTGGRDLILYERNFLGRRKSTVIYQGLEKDGLITAVSWNGPYIAFTNESGTRIYDTKLSRTITLVQPLHKTEAYYSSKFPPRHSWLNSETLCIGWANTICVLLITTKRRISTTNTMSLNMAGTPGPKHGQILHRWILPDFFVAGISYTLAGSENAQSKWPSSLESPNGSVNGLNLTEAKPAANATSWREIVVFGLKLVEDGEGNVNDDKSSISNTSVKTTLTTAMLAELNVSNQYQSHRCSAQLLLLRPSALPTPVGIGSPSVDDFQLMAEDTIEMKQSDPKYLARFQLAALPRDNLFFLLGPKELIEASEMQNKRIHLRLLRERIERTRKRIRALHFRLTDVTEEDVQREKRAKEMEQNIAIMEDETTALNHTTSEMRSTYTPLRNELVLRRRFAINELRRIFFPSEIDMSDQETTFFNGTKRMCSCKRLDTIRANHLPVHLQSSKDAKFVHTDFEISASAGYLLHLIECFCRILHLPTKYMPFVMGSRSHFLDRSNLDLYNLFPGISPKRKKSRGYVSAVYFLDRSLPILADTVVQLRADCGLFTKERDRPVRNMLEIMVLCVGRNLSTSSPNSPVEMEPLNPFSAMSSTFF